VPLSIRRLSGSTFSLDVSHGFDPARTAFECGRRRQPGRRPPRLWWLPCPPPARSRS